MALNRVRAHCNEIAIINPAQCAPFPPLTRILLTLNLSSSWNNSSREEKNLILSFYWVLIDFLLCDTNEILPEFLYLFSINRLYSMYPIDCVFAEGRVGCARDVGMLNNRIRKKRVDITESAYTWCADKYLSPEWLIS